MDLHTGDMPYACSHHATHVQAAAWPRVEGGSQVAFTLSFSLHLSGSLGTPWTSARLTRSPGVTVTPTAAGGGGGVCAGKEVVVSNCPTKPVPSPQSELSEARQIARFPANFRPGPEDPAEQVWFWGALTERHGVHVGQRSSLGLFIWLVGFALLFFLVDLIPCRGRIGPVWSFSESEAHDMTNESLLNKDTEVGKGL